jgi:hypothetical protein
VGLALPVLAGLPVKTAGDPAVPPLVAGGCDVTGAALVGAGAGTDETCDTWETCETWPPEPDT